MSATSSAPKTWSASFRQSRVEPRQEAGEAIGAGYLAEALASQGVEVERVAAAVIERNPDRVLVDAKLAAGDMIVTEGLQRLRNGAEVQIYGEKKPDADLSRRDTLYLAVPRTAPGLTVEGDWDPLGMRATVSRNLVFKDVFVPDDAALMPQGLYFQAASRWPHMFMTLAPTYMGIAQAAYDFTVAYLRGEIPGTGPVKRRQFATKQIAVAEMFIKLEQTRNLFLRAIEDAKVDPSKSTRLRAYAAQYTIMENAQDLARLAIRTCGGQSMLKSLPLERLYRDARCGALMLPWTAELCMDRIGREALYEPGEKDE